MSSSVALRVLLRTSCWWPRRRSRRRIGQPGRCQRSAPRERRDRAREEQNEAQRRDDDGHRDELGRGLEARRESSRRGTLAEMPKVDRAGRRPPDAIRQRAEPVARDDDLVPRPQPPADLEAAAPRHGAEPEELAGSEALVERREADVLGERAHGTVTRRARGPELAVDKDSAREATTTLLRIKEAPAVVRVPQLVGRDERRGHRSAERLGLDEAKTDRRELVGLRVARGEVVDQHKGAVLEDGRLTLGARRVPRDARTDQQRDFEFVVEPRGVRRPLDGRAVADEGQRVADVVGRLARGR
mmetsp:Transcript_7517/g.31109  ORF Transcript_7517/g.31109 Transcript_7517/m.31109 type:complete len:301 (+) Transcript_7517:118-1020(+)